MDTGREVNALEFLVDRVRQLESQMAFVSMTVAILGQGNPGDDPVRKRAREILEMRAASHEVGQFLSRFAPAPPSAGHTID